MAAEMAIVLAGGPIISSVSSLFSVISCITTAVRKARECKDRCLDLGQRVRLLRTILPGFSSAAANDRGTARALSRLGEALLGALELVQSCDRERRQFLFIFSAEERHAKFDVVRKKIDSCQGDLLLAVAAHYCRHLRTPIVYNIRIDSAVLHVLVHPRGGAASSSAPPQPEERRRRHGKATLARTATTRTTHSYRDIIISNVQIAPRVREAAPSRPDERRPHGRTTPPLQLLAGSYERPSRRPLSYAPAEARVAGPGAHRGDRVEPALTRPSHRMTLRETPFAHAAAPSAPTPVVPRRGRATGPSAAATTPAVADAIARALANRRSDGRG
ncbi:hypothetical protein ZWY2020_050289 [Hordeum vulgare]|nr:hypothetical protein ZWY2020_050289 [Hordeum vulgare]